MGDAADMFIDSSIFYYEDDDYDLCDLD